MVKFGKDKCYIKKMTAIISSLEENESKGEVEKQYSATTLVIQNLRK